MRTTSTASHTSSGGGERTLAGLGAAGLLAGTALIGVGVLGAGHADAATATIKYACSAAGVGDLTSGGKDPFLVTLSADLTDTVAPGDTFAPVAVTAKVQASALASGVVGTQTIMPGFSLTDYTVGPFPQQLRLDYGKTTNTTGGALVLTASGETSGFTVPDAPGTYPITVGAFTNDLTLESGFVAKLTCTPLAGQNLTLGALTIASPSTTSSAPSSSSSAPTSSSPAPTSSTPAPTTSSPAPTTAGPTPSEVQTGSAGDTGGPDLGLIGAGLTSLGGLTLAGAALTRRRSRN